ncbi:MAG: molybdopterin dinucleotide binding domain-containing protein [Saprospiraceae bacterium]
MKNARRVVFMHPDDMKERGIKTKDKVDITNEHGGQMRVAPQFTVVPYNIPRRCLAAYFPEANVLVPIDSYAEHSMTPASKRIVVTLRLAGS